MRILTGTTNAKITIYMELCKKMNEYINGNL